MRDLPLFLPFLGALAAGSLRMVSVRLRRVGTMLVILSLVITALLLPGTPIAGVAAGSLDHLAVMIPLLALLFVAGAAEGESPGEGDRVMLLGFVTTGALLLALGRDWILVGAGLELSSLPLAYYLLRQRGGDSRASLYLLLSALVGLVLLAIGVVLWIGAAHTLHVSLSGLVYTKRVGAAVLVLCAAIAYKIGWLPFAAWIPQVYRDGDSRFVAFLATAPKIAAAILMYRLAVTAGVQVWPMLRWFVWASILLGVFGGMAQKDIRVLLGYSGISQMGYALLAASLPSSAGAPLFAAFVAAYAVATWAAFALLRATPEGDLQLHRFIGAAKVDPLWTIAFMLILLSQAGVPFVLGFWTKFLIFTRPALAGAWPSVWVALFGSLVGLYMYLRVAKFIFVSTATTDAHRLPVSRGGYRYLGILAAILLAVTGIVPGWFFSLFGG